MLIVKNKNVIEDLLFDFLWNIEKKKDLKCEINFDFYEMFITETKS